MANENTKKIRQILLQHKTITKPELAKETGLTVAACGYLLNALVEKDEVIAEDFRTSNGGRPAMSYRYNAKKVKFLCLYAISESGAEILSYRIIDALGEIHGASEFKEKRIHVRAISNRILKLLQSNPEIRIVTIGIQGGVCNGVVEFSDFPELDGIDLSKELSQKIGLPVYVENDMNTIALGYSEKNHQEKDVAILFVPKGNPPAGGFLTDGKILHGSTNLAGELSCYPFAFDRSKQKEIFDSFKTAFPPIKQILLSSIVFLDPAVVVFTGGFAEELAKQNLEVQIRNHLKRPYRPRLEFIPNPIEEYFSGLAKIAEDHFLNF